MYMNNCSLQLKRCVNIAGMLKACGNVKAHEVLSLVKFFLYTSLTVVIHHWLNFLHQLEWKNVLVIEKVIDMKYHFYWINSLSDSLCTRDQAWCLQCIVVSHHSYISLNVQSRNLAFPNTFLFTSSISFPTLLFFFEGEFVHCNILKIILYMINSTSSFPSLSHWCSYFSSLHTPFCK